MLTPKEVAQIHKVHNDEIIDLKRRVAELEKEVQKSKKPRARAQKETTNE